MPCAARRSQTLVAGCPEGQLNQVTPKLRGRSAYHRPPQEAAHAAQASGSAGAWLAAPLPQREGHERSGDLGRLSMSCCRRQRVPNPADRPPTQRAALSYVTLTFPREHRTATSHWETVITLSAVAFTELKAGRAASEQRVARSQEGEWVALEPVPG